MYFMTDDAVCDHCHGYVNKVAFFVEDFSKKSSFSTYCLNCLKHIETTGRVTTIKKCHVVEKTKLPIEARPYFIKLPELSNGEISCFDLFSINKMGLHKTIDKTKLANRESLLSIENKEEITIGKIIHHDEEIPLNQLDHYLEDLKNSTPLLLNPQNQNLLGGNYE